MNLRYIAENTKNHNFLSRLIPSSINTSPDDTKSTHKALQNIKGEDSHHKPSTDEDTYSHASVCVWDMNKEA